MLIAIGMILTANLSAQDIKKNMKEMRDEIRNYKQTNIIPKLNEWKSEIDKSIKSEDLTTLNKLRDEAYKLRQEIRTKVQALKNENVTDKKELKEKVKDLRKESMDDFKAIAKQLKPIVESNEDFFDEFFDNNKPTGEKWREDIKEIMDKWMEKNREEMKDNENMPPRGKRGPKHHGGHFGKDNPKAAAAKILLWNGKDDIEDEMEMMEEMGFAPESDDFDIEKGLNYPNPFKEKTNIDFNLKSAGDYKVTLNDENGRVVKEIFNGYLKAGKNSLELIPDASLKNGLYFYRVEGENTNITGKVLYQK